jgi:hypothetical protein
MEWDGPGGSGPLSLMKFELAARLQTKNGALWDTNVNEIVWERIQLSLAKYAHSLTTSAFIPTRTHYIRRLSVPWNTYAGS